MSHDWRSPEPSCAGACTAVSSLPACPLPSQPECWLGAHAASCCPMLCRTRCRYFNYRVTRFLSEKGFYETWDFFDSFTWYPLGRVVGGTMYPGGWPRPGLGLGLGAWLAGGAVDSESCEMPEGRGWAAPHADMNMPTQQH